MINKMIGEIAISPQKPRAGESFRVSVKPANAKSWNDDQQSKIKINGMFGADHWFQAEDTETYSIEVSYSSGRESEVKFEEVVIKTLSEENFKKKFEELKPNEKKEISSLRARLPILRMGRYLDNLEKVQFCLAPEPVFRHGRTDMQIDKNQILTIPATWKINRKTLEKMDDLARTKYVFDQPTDDKDFNSHLIEVATKRFKEDIIIKRSINIQNLYAYNKKNGFLIPQLQTNEPISYIKDNFCTTTITILNPYNETITISGKKIRTTKGQSNILPVVHLEI